MTLLDYVCLFSFLYALYGLGYYMGYKKRDEQLKGVGKENK